MNITRKGFLGAAVGGTVLLLVQGCGGGGDDEPASTTDISYSHAVTVGWA